MHTAESGLVVRIDCAWIKSLKDLITIVTTVRFIGIEVRVTTKVIAHSFIVLHVHIIAAQLLMLEQRQRQPFSQNQLIARVNTKIYNISLYIGVIATFCVDIGQNGHRQTSVCNTSNSDSVALHINKFIHFLSAHYREAWRIGIRTWMAWLPMCEKHGQIVFDFDLINNVMERCNKLSIARANPAPNVFVFRTPNVPTVAVWFCGERWNAMVLFLIFTVPESTDTDHSRNRSRLPQPKRS